MSSASSDKGNDAIQLERRPGVNFERSQSTVSDIQFAINPRQPGGLPRPDLSLQLRRYLHLSPLLNDCPWRPRIAGYWQDRMLNDRTFQ